MVDTEAAVVIEAVEEAEVEEILEDVVVTIVEMAQTAAGLIMILTMKLLVLNHVIRLKPVQLVSLFKLLFRTFWKQ